MAGKPITLKRIRLFLIIPVLTLILSIPFENIRAEVILNYFRASSQTSGILIEWETSAESNSSGFYILRSIRQDQDFSRINIFFLSDSEAGEGVFYSYLDDQVLPGTLYYYKLEAIDLNGSIQTFGPVAVGFLMQTPTATRTGTPARTVPSTPRTPTSTSTPPVQPTSSLITQISPSMTISVPISTVTESPTITGTVSILPSQTPTLEPLPSFEFLFPAPTETAVMIATPTSQPMSSEAMLTATTSSQPISSRNVFLIGIVILLWAFLMVFWVLWLKNLFEKGLIFEEGE